MVVLRSTAVLLRGHQQRASPQSRYDLDQPDAGLDTRGEPVKYIVIAIVALAIAVPAFAGGSDNSNASYCGATHGAFADQNGNFGFLGQDHGGGTPGYHGGAVGQEPGATGYNNSSVDCAP